MDKIRVVIFGKQISSRKKLRTVLEAESDFEIIGEAGSGTEIYNYVVTRSFDILLFNLADTEEMNMLRTESRYRPGIRTVVVYDDNDLPYKKEMLSSGAKAYVSSANVDTELIVAIHEAMAGKMHLSYPLFEDAIENYIKLEPAAVSAPYGSLTKRESEVFNLVVKGLTSAQIGIQLSISRRTVEIHRANILRKLNLASQYKQIKSYAVELGILKPENGNFANNIS
jgi:DNA-binding NarL/FixJ family response regulator